VQPVDAIIGGEALAKGTLTRGQLRWGYDLVFPGVYLPKDARRTVPNLAHAAWLWSGRSGVIAGRTAAALLGVTWVDVDAPIELICTKRSSIPELLTRHERLAHDEIVRLEGLPVTAAARTALDLARHWPRDIAVTHLDALKAATDVSVIEIADLLRRYQRGAGVTKARGALRLMDGGAESVRDTTLRLAMIDAGFPRPATQIEVSEGVYTVFVALGWEQHRIALTHADFGETTRGHPWHELSRNNFLQLQGWVNLYVRETQSWRETTYRVREAFRVQRRRGL
jgi:hypothetical protein